MDSSRNPDPSADHFCVFSTRSTGKDVQEVIDEPRAAFTFFSFLSVVYAWLWLRSAFLFEPVTRPDSKAFQSKQLGPCLSASCFCTEINHASSIFAVQQRMGIAPCATAQTASMDSTADHGIPRFCPTPHPCNCLLLGSSGPLLGSASSSSAHTHTKGC